MAAQAEKAAAYHSHRLESLVGLPGREGFEPLPKSQAGKTIAVFTSGGDSQGMSQLCCFHQLTVCCC